MSREAFHTEDYVDPHTGRRFIVEFSYDDDMGPPQDNADGHGVIVELDYDPHDEDYLRYHLGLPDEEEDDGDPATIEKLVRHKLMRPLQKSYHLRRDCQLFYDVWATTYLARREWCQPGATDAEVAEAVERDFAYIQGWYNDDWCYCVLSVTPCTLPHEQDDPEDAPEPLDEFTQYLGGIEYGLNTADEKHYHQEVIREQVAECLYYLNKSAYGNSGGAGGAYDTCGQVNAGD